MIVIVDGGSTKCDWVILDDLGNLLYKTETIGFNPNTANIDFIVPEIQKNHYLVQHQSQIKKLYYYGSGCGTPKNKKIVEIELQKFFTATEITVKEDLTAAAYSAYSGKPCIVCILGTGSNSCFFDGEIIRRDLPSLGFLLGDEGSGSAIGKHVLRRFFMKKLPEDLQKLFSEKYQLSIEEAIKNMYHNSRVNAYLAGFNTFVAENKKHPYFQKMILDEMKNFLDYHVLPYPESKSVEINFIGSIPFYYEDILRSAAADLHLSIGKIVQKPIDNLVDYHKNYILNL